MIGRLDQRITLQAATRTPDGAGGLVEAWADFADVPNVWAGVVPKGGTEGIEDGAVNAAAMFEFTIRNREDVSELDRLMWNNVPYNIRRVDRRGVREPYLKLMAERGVAQ